MQLSKVRVNRSKFFLWVTKFVLAYSVFIIVQVWLLNIFLMIPRLELLMLMFLLIAPALISGPLIYRANSNPANRNVGLFILAIEFHFICFALTLAYAGESLGYLHGNGVTEAIPIIFLGALITSAMLYKVFGSSKDRAKTDKA